MPPVTRIGDKCTGHDACPPRPAISGEPSVTVSGSPVVRVGDAYAVHGCPVHPGHPGVLTAGAPYISVAGALLGRIGDAVSCGGTSAQGEPTVTAGNMGGGSGSGGGSGGDNPKPDGEDSWDERFTDVYDRISSQLDDKDRLLLCLPDIAAAESERVDGADRKGWLYLRKMFQRWFSGKGSGTPTDNTIADGIPFWVDWKWIMSYAHARKDYDQFIDPRTEKHQVWNLPAQQQLGKILQREGYLGSVRKNFDFCALPWQDWERVHYTSRAVERGSTVDGLMSAIAGFSLKALASGYAEPNGDGTHTITVTQISVYVEDRFNFEKSDHSYKDMLMYWNCAKLLFSLLPSEGAMLLMNDDFRAFRDKHQLGRDFLVFTQPHRIEIFQGASYVYP